MNSLWIGLACLAVVAAPLRRWIMRQGISASTATMHIELIF